MATTKATAMAHPEFPLDPNLVYLNHAGVGTWPQRTRDAVNRFADECLHRGAADYPNWLEAEDRLRARLARLMGVAGAVSDIALVPNTSAGLSMVAHGVTWQPGDEVIINDQEFPSNRWVWQSLARHYGVHVRQVRLSDGATPEDALIDALTPRTRLLPISSVQYGTGLRMDLERLSNACRERGVLLCVDAIQTLGALQLAVDADFIVADGHKWMLGPEGIGGLYVHPRVRDELRIWQIGWHMAEDLGAFDRPDWDPAGTGRCLEPGSPNLLGSHALEASLAVLEDVGLKEVERRVLTNAREAMEGVRRHGFELVTPTEADRHAGIVTFRVPGAAPERLLAALRARDVACASRCGGIRFSAHFYNTAEDLEEAWRRLQACLAAE
ncbi:aminotransferase class V-fold PLP-dependent enzyme [Halorhodospira sp. 9622]|uniref:aminotransferase class V-fold PLP-dependent enzyme n=1 Tax=Halorhodospira sp. 9622 TaxID=2899136 RepID=UPI001EE8B0B1|nr:aminotransferase class V-fold PLP-dependent enzyme [Halorhodospira sp. 9622]MCG5537521.1 aminotransferase class V-fold PLP-dependent enzyme [Halorhodospira sp. 9622]